MLLIWQESNYMKKHLIFVSFLLFLFCGCTSSADSVSEEQKEYVRDIFAMDTYMYLKAYGECADNALGMASEKILLLENEFSVTSEQSDTWAINHSNGVSVNVSQDTMTLLQTAVDIGEKTNGALDITLYPVISLWGFTTDTQQVPEPETLEKMLSLADYTKISISEDSVQLPDGMQLDFGALAKGYTSDCIIDILNENGVESALVNLGGNVQALGTKPDGTSWKVGIQNPFSESEQICILDIADCAVITSGNYERYFTQDGINYWHIIDSADGYPADNGLVSVTVIGKSGLLCDSLSTALFVLGTDKAIDYWKQQGDFDMILVTDDATVYYTENLSDIITFTETLNTKVIIND